MSVPTELIPVIKKLLDYLVRGDFDGAIAFAWSSRLTASDLERAVSEYGGDLITPPDEAFDVAESYDIEGEPGAWAVDVPLWTQDERCSDLTLSLLLDIAESGAESPTVRVAIEDLHGFVREEFSFRSQMAECDSDTSTTRTASGSKEMSERQLRRGWSTGLRAS